MIVRIRLRLGRRPQPQQSSHRGLALATAALLTPAALVAFVLAVWSFSAEAGWTAEFGIRGGIFSRWQVWLMLSMVLQAGALVLNRYGRDDEEASMP